MRDEVSVQGVVRRKRARRRVDRVLVSFAVASSAFPLSPFRFSRTLFAATTYGHRALKWVGHVIRMDYDQLPRKLLFAWVNNARPRGRPPITYGQRILRLVDDALEVAEPVIRRAINGRRGVGWVEFAKNDRAGWRRLVNAGRKFGYEKKKVGGAARKPTALDATLGAGGTGESAYDAALRRDLGFDVAPEKSAEGVLAAIARAAIARACLSSEKE